MHGAPLWARTATVAAGPVFNFVLSILVFTAVMMSGGKTADPLTVGELKPLPVEGVTLQPGDEILSVAGAPLPDIEDGEAYDAFLDTLPARALLDYEVRRQAARVTAQGPHLMRPLVGHMPSRLLAASALAGAALLVAADIVVRLFPAGPELKLGVVTSLIGAPFFLWLVLRTRRTGP